MWSMLLLDAVHLGLQRLLRESTQYCPRQAQQDAEEKSEDDVEQLRLPDVLAHMPRAFLDVLQRLGTRRP